MRAARRMTDSDLPSRLDCQWMLCREIEAGVNGAKIDTFTSIAELFHIVEGVLAPMQKQEKN